MRTATPVRTQVNGHASQRTSLDWLFPNSFIAADTVGDAGGNHYPDFDNRPLFLARRTQRHAPERGCARSVSRSGSGVLRLVCDTAALRVLSTPLESCGRLTS